MVGTNVPEVADMITRVGDASAVRVFFLRENFIDNHCVTYIFASVGGTVIIPNDA